MRVVAAIETYQIQEDIKGYHIVGMIPRTQNMIEYHLKQDASAVEKVICPKCHGNNIRMARKRVRSIRALPQEEFRVVLKIEVTDYECMACRTGEGSPKLFTPPLVEVGGGEIPPRGHYTFAYKRWVHSMHQGGLSCGAISKKTGLATSTVCDLLKEK